MPRTISVISSRYLQFKRPVTTAQLLPFSIGRDSAQHALKALSRTIGQPLHRGKITVVRLVDQVLQVSERLILDDRQRSQQAMLKSLALLTKGLAIGSRYHHWVKKQGIVARHTTFHAGVNEFEGQRLVSRSHDSRWTLAPIATQAFR